MGAAANALSTTDPLCTAMREVATQLGRCVKGKQAAIERCLIAICAGGHLLLEDQPGVGKTTLARALAASLGVQFSRVQFTADLLPSDVLGMSVWSPAQERFTFHPGPVFAQLLLADEINRAPARTQSALLQAMAEKCVSIDGQDRPLFAGFCVVATQNPAQHSGTYPLPQSQRDRFAMRLCLGYPEATCEQEIYAGQIEDPQTIPARLGPEDLVAIQAQVPKLALHPALANYIQHITHATRQSQRTEIGLSVRAGLSWLACAKAKAWLDGRDLVVPDDLQDLAMDCLAHRVWIRDCPASTQQAQAQDLIAEILATTPLP